MCVDVLTISFSKELFGSWQNLGSGLVHLCLFFPISNVSVHVLHVCEMLAM